MSKPSNHKNPSGLSDEQRQAQTTQETLWVLADLVDRQRQEGDSFTDTLERIACGRYPEKEFALEDTAAETEAALAVVTQARRCRRLMIWRRAASTAAVIVFAILAGSLLFNHRQEQTADAMALVDVKQALSRVVYKRFDSYRNGALITSSWEGGQGIHCHKNDQGGVVFVTANPQQKWEYNPKTNIITLSWPGDWYRGSQRTALESVSRLFDRYTEYAQLIESIPGQLDGRKVAILEIEGTQRDSLERVVIWCDPQRALPLKLQRGDLEIRYSYPEKGPQSIYDLGVSRDCRVVSTVPSDEVKQVIGAFDHWRQAIYEEALATNRTMPYHTPEHSGRFIEDDYSRENNLIAIEQEIQGENRYHSPSGSYYRTLPARRVFYFDPRKDYMWVRYDEFIEPDPPWQVDKNWRFGRKMTPLQKRHTIYEVTQFGQTSEGIGYPKTVEKREVE